MEAPPSFVQPCKDLASLPFEKVELHVKKGSVAWRGYISREERLLTVIWITKKESNLDWSILTTLLQESALVSLLESFLLEGHDPSPYYVVCLVSFCIYSARCLSHIYLRFDPPFSRSSLLGVISVNQYCIAAKISSWTIVYPLSPVYTERIMKVEKVHPDMMPFPFNLS